MTDKNKIDIKFTTTSGDNLALTFVPGVFTPNTTTNLLIDGVKSKITEPVTLLDLGCGTGVVGVALHIHALVKSPVYASDLSEPGVVCSRINFERYNCDADVRVGSLFQPWSGNKFDVIVDDISGIAQSVAEVSPWFPGVPCDTGADGVDLVVNIISNAKNHLNEGGCLFFPVLSLSNVDKIIEAAQKNFFKVELVGRQDWPLPKELHEHLPLLRKLSQEGSIKLQEKFGMVLCYTEVYCASSPIV